MLMPRHWTVKSLISLTCCAKQRQACTHSLASSHARQLTSLRLSPMSHIEHMFFVVHSHKLLSASLHLRSFSPSSFASPRQREWWQTVQDGQHLLTSIDGWLAQDNFAADVKMDDHLDFYYQAHALAFLSPRQVTSYQDTWNSHLEQSSRMVAILLRPNRVLMQTRRWMVVSHSFPRLLDGTSWARWNEASKDQVEASSPLDKIDRRKQSENGWMAKQECKTSPQRKQHQARPSVGKYAHHIVVYCLLYCLLYCLNFTIE